MADKLFNIEERKIFEENTEHHTCNCVETRPYYSALFNDLKTFATYYCPGCDHVISDDDFEKFMMSVEGKTKTDLSKPIYDEEMGRTKDSKEWADPNKVGGKYMAGVIADFAPALKEIAKLGSMNNKPNGKYERGSWKEVKNPEVEYHDAFWRHLLEGRHKIDPETGMPHDVAIAWNAIALVWFRLAREARNGKV